VRGRYHKRFTSYDDAYAPKEVSLRGRRSRQDPPCARAQAVYLWMCKSWWCWATKFGMLLRTPCDLRDLWTAWKRTHDRNGWWGRGGAGLVRMEPWWEQGMSHSDLKTNPNTSYMCFGIKFHTYYDSVYRNQCYKLHYISTMSLQK
jgi:hypothetical protein